MFLCNAKWRAFFSFAYYNRSVSHDTMIWQCFDWFYASLILEYIINQKWEMYALTKRKYIVRNTHNFSVRKILIIWLLKSVKYIFLDLNYYKYKEKYHSIILRWHSFKIENVYILFANFLKIRKSFFISNFWWIIKKGRY